MASNARRRPTPRSEMPRETRPNVRGRPTAIGDILPSVLDRLNLLASPEVRKALAAGKADEQLTLEAAD